MPKHQPPRARKRPQQSRSVMAVQAIQQACLTILNSEGADKLTTERIADVAGVNIASVYQYFPNKEAILSDVYEELLAEMADRAAQRFLQIQALAEESLEATLAAIIDLECEQLLALQSLDPNFFLKYQHSFDIHQRVNELTQSQSNPSWEEWLDQLLQRSCPPSEQAELRGLLLRQSLQGNLHITLRDRPKLLSSASFRKELLKLLLGYVQAP